jgi:hypothetical protein
VPYGWYASKDQSTLTVCRQFTGSNRSRDLQTAIAWRPINAQCKKNADTILFRSSGHSSSQRAYARIRQPDWAALFRYILSHRELIVPLDNTDSPKLLDIALEIRRLPSATR